MLESISARGWGRASLVVACIAVVVIGYVYGSELRACGPNPSPFAQHRQWPVPAAGWVLFSVALALFGSCIFRLLHYSSTRKVRGRIVHWQANEWPVWRRYTVQVLLYLSRPLVWLWLTFCFGGGVGWSIIVWFSRTC